MSRIIVVPEDSVDPEDVKKVFALEFPLKDPGEETYRILDWSERLDSGDAVATSEWSVGEQRGPDVLTLLDGGFTETTTKVWLKKGVDNRTYTLTNKIVTEADEKMEQSVKILVKSR